MAIVDLVMPKLGESIMEATILKWHKQPGDTIALDETVLEIATDKVDSEVPSTAAGTIQEILFNVNEVVPIGTVIARIQTSATQPASSIPSTPPTSHQAPSPASTQPTIQQSSINTQITAHKPLTIGANRFYSPLVRSIADNCHRGKVHDLRMNQHVAFCKDNWTIGNAVKGIKIGDNSDASNGGIELLRLIYHFRRTGIWQVVNQRYNIGHKSRN